jgi:medium-chain acyl-[acyl-carrier-protein] hydrolase
MVTTTPSRDPWIAHSRPRPQARIRLFCFPYAGGSAAVYRGWSDRLPAEIEVLPVELPGRASRFREEPFRRLDELVAKTAEALQPRFDRPFAFFGHSMGALIAFELARHLRREGMEEPRWLLLSARRAPHLSQEEEPYYDLPEAEFVDKLRELNGTPEEVLQHPELMQMMIPLLRADFQVNETYDFAPEEPLACPISALGGVGDPEVSRDHLEAWKEHTSGPFSVRMFEGDHFYIDQRQSTLFQAVGQDLAALSQVL